jgi:uncharacterized protein YwbE
MKALKFALCMVLVASAVLYAAKNIMGPTMDGLVFVSNDAGTTLEEYTTNGMHWIVIAGGGPKTKITIDGKQGTSPAGQNIVINDCKMVKGKKITGNINNMLFGVFSPVGTFDPADLGIMTNFSPGNCGQVKLKGVTVGTVLGADMKKVMADAVRNVATDSGFKGKGVTVQTKVGNIGGDPGDNGWLGVPPDLQPIAALADYSDGCLIKKAKAKGAVDNLDIYASPAKPTKSKLQGKVPGVVTVFNTAATDWKAKNVTVNEAP